VWRLDESGQRVRYEPAGVVEHEPRHSVRAWLAQRAAYGSSAADLARRHPGSVPPVAVSGWSAAVWLLAVGGAPVTAVAVAAGTAAALARKLTGLPRPYAEALLLAGRGHLFAGRMLAGAVTRAWWPLLLVGATRSRRVRRALVMAALVPPVVDWVRQRPPVDLVRYTALRLLDDGAYSVGLWRGAIERHTAAPLLPDFSSWPRPSRYARRRAAP
jgi:hypothetical protein